MHIDARPIQSSTSSATAIARIRLALLGALSASTPHERVDWIGRPSVGVLARMALDTGRSVCECSCIAVGKTRSARVITCASRSEYAPHGHPLMSRLLQETVLSHTRGSDHNVIIFIASTNKRRWSAGEQAGKQCAFMCTCVCTQPVIDDEPRISCDSTNMQRARRTELSFSDSSCLEL